MDVSTAFHCDYCGRQHELVLENASRVAPGKNQIQYKSARIVDPCAEWRKRIAGDPNVKIITRRSN